MTLSLCSTARTLTQTASRVHVTYAFLHISYPPTSRGERVFLLLERLAGTARRLMDLLELGFLQTCSRTILQGLRNLVGYSIAYLGHRHDRHATPSRKHNPVRCPSSISKYTMNVNRTIPRDSLPREDSLSPDPQQSLHVVRAARSVSIMIVIRTRQHTKTTAQSYILNNT